ncbi:MAG TPA: zinc-dependent metalloprotease, partial [Longimicrobiales bacterium]|nr:zinc-dependent metalloprotease [Longimicrobiales bacterium]
AGMRRGPIIAVFDVQAYAPADSAAVVDVTELFTTANPLMGSIDGVQRDRSWIEDVWAFERNVDIEATQTGTARPSGPTGAPAGGGRPNVVTSRIHWSMLKLPDDPMMPRLRDRRVGFISSGYTDYSSERQGIEQRRNIHRFRLEPSDTAAFRRGELVEPGQKIVYWIDPATPEWLRPWVKVGVDKWNAAFEEAGFRDAIEGRMAPADDPDFNLHDARYSVIYWRPSSVANATGGQTVDPRTGEILKGEVNMYHNIMNLLRNWYFTQVSPVDPRAQTLPLPDSLMGRLVEYVVTHEIGHSIGFPHNMKSSGMYPPDSIRSESFLRRMGGHVATLMDYSRFNYVVQPEDNIPPDLLIPNVGPYDKYAVMWGYRPILDARTPEEERAQLNEWARMQDTIPWLRFTTDDAPNDPNDLTEAVGDADAVQSSTLGLRNLQRVLDLLIPVAERPGEDYSLLDELYGGVVGQWGRYMSHVAAVVGGADTQERYGTGPRFEPVERARQVEAVRFLNANAFDTPEMLIRPDVLRRIEAEGVIARIRGAQSRVLRTLLNDQRLNRLIEYEALAAPGRRAYTVADLVGDMRQGVWTEVLRGPVRVDVYRRNLQRAYLEAVDAELNPPPARENQPPSPFGPRRPPRFNSDVRPVLRGELRELDRLIARAIPRAQDAMTRLHLEDVRMEIERILDPQR